MVYKGKMTTLDQTASWLVLIGALNWGLTAVGWNLVEWLGDLLGMAWVEPVVYGAVGLSALYVIYKMFA